MGRRRLLASIAIGAAVGGLTALFDRDTRIYTKDKLKTMTTQTSYCLRHPSETVHNARVVFEQFNKTFTYQVENAVNALEQVENTLDQVTKKRIE
ncbi:YtxH domain-containing protein [Ornithinibacillus sp. L9]|uniref:YtxH domain-containing protein n=1 Tax=Ornithinibacillus caprae TaxID=2678566 RepID=A0A6N8FFY7_9BACI|nr:YtxH domain-containing protein [Ornithinibacillus caprae]MUK88355.1 YtxH domain-containing protein [Ornithinibacillus caprae]